MSKKLTIKDFKGGLNKTEPTNLADNEFETLTNFFYNSSKRVQTRRGIAQFGSDVPDAVTVVNDLNATTDITATDDAVNLATGTAIRGTFSVTFDITVATTANDFATITWAGAGTVDISSAKGYVSLFFKVPVGFNTNLTSITFRLGSDSTNYYEWTLPALTENSSLPIFLNFSDATTTGVPVDTAIDYFRYRITYTAGYTNKVGVALDSIRCYSANYTKPVTSYFYHEYDDLSRDALCAAGANMFRYDETSTKWECIDTGLTEFETATGMTTFRTRWDFVPYRNIIYMCNGVDSYRAWNKTLITVYAGEPKHRYLEYMQDRVFGGGADTIPSTLDYINAAAADASNINANSVVIGGDDKGRINGLRELGQFILVGKNNKIYNVDVATPSALPIDAENGFYSNRAITPLENGTAYYSGIGLELLHQRSGVTGAQAIAYEPLSANLQPIFDEVDVRQYNANCGFYNLPLRNYYISIDTDDDNRPDRTLVLTTLVNKAWTEYTLPATYQYGLYKDSSGVVHYLITSASSGQIYEIETGFDDFGQAIEHTLKTKQWDFDDPSTWKDFQFVDIFGLKSEGDTISVQVYVDGNTDVAIDIDDIFIDTNAVATPIGYRPVGSEVIGGGGGDDVDTFPYFVRIPMYSGGNKIQVEMSSNSASLVWTLDKMTITYDENSFDIFPNANIA